MLKQLEPAKLTDEQVAKIKEAATKAQAESDKIIADAGIEKTALQARNKAVAEARQAGKSQKKSKRLGRSARFIDRRTKGSVEKRGCCYGQVPQAGLGSAHCRSTQRTARASKEEPGARRNHDRKKAA